MFDLAAAVDNGPRWLRRAFRSLADGEGVAGRALDRLRHPYSPDDIPPVPETHPEANVRLVIGPNNAAEQGYRWARAVERARPDAVAVSMYGFGVNRFAAQIDLRIPESVYLRASAWHDEFERFLVSRTHVVWESGLPLLGRRYGTVSAEVDRLSRDGVACALMFHGSDIRPPALHATTTAWSPFATPSREVKKLEAEAARNARLAEELGVPVFVSTPDLLRWQPGASWCPVVVDPEPWRAAATRVAAERIGRHRPVVIHAPSNPWIKGTQALEPLVQRLDAEGVIEYRPVRGATHAQMPAIYAEADVVLDQFALGGYGVAACEAMATGRVVMGHVDADARAEVRDRAGAELPIHEVTIDRLEAALRHFAAAPDDFAELKVAGPRFVDAVHSGRFSAEVLGAFFG